MKAGILAIFLGFVATVPAQDKSGTTLTYQEQPSIVEQAQASARKSFRSTRVTYSGPVAEIFGPKQPPAEVEARPQRPLDDITVDLITGRPRGIVLFAINF